MTAPYPHTHYACPCSDLTSAPIHLNRPERGGSQTSADESEDATFNPHDPRANYSLYPLDHLLYCDECDAIRCPRCWTEEVINWYCPSCLFEVPSSAVKSDGNRCSRNCYNCPCCTSPLAITAIGPTSSSEDLLKPTDSPSQETYILQCQYCNWSSLDADIQLSRPTKITEQLIRIRKSRGWKPPDPTTPDDVVTTPEPQTLGHDDAFANLMSFYKEQLNEVRDGQNPYAGSPYASPANLARIMSMYGGMAYNTLKKTRQKPQPMREARALAEGLASFTLGDTDPDQTILEKMSAAGWEGVTSEEQRSMAPINQSARFVDDLWPVATALRTRRGKRCSSCRQFLTRPDPKVGSVRYRIRLLALNFAPNLTIRSFQPTLPPTNPAFKLRMEESPELHLSRNLPQQYILTVRNPIFESIKVTLATPAVTPGKLASRVTVLCPSFTVGPAGDVWEEALGGSTTKNPVDGGPKEAMASLTGMNDVDRQPEAGKVWERTRNSTSVILEVVPAGAQQVSSALSSTVPVAGKDEDGDRYHENEDDENMLEIPVFVRVEWEAHVDDSISGLGKKDGERKASMSAGETTVQKQLGYWCVLGVGRIGP